MRHNEKRFLSKHKHVQIIAGNTLRTFPVMYEEEFDYAGSDEMFHAHQIVLGFTVKAASYPEGGDQAWDDIVNPKATPITPEYEERLFKLTLEERVNAKAPKLYVSYDSVLPVD